MSEDRLLQEFNARDYAEISDPTGFNPGVIVGRVLRPAFCSR